MSRRHAAMSFILITVLLDMLGIGVIIPVLPKLVTSLHGGDLSSGSAVFGWFVASYALLQFLFSPIIGNLSDAYGRRPIILVSLLGAGLDYALLAWAPTLEWLFIGRVIAGITGANITAANAYIADVSPPEQRARNFGLIGACFGVGFILGPALGGLVAGYGLRAPFVVAAGLTLLNTLYGFFVLPESLAKEQRRPFDWKGANPLSSLQALRKYPVVLGLTFTLLLDRIAHDVLPSTWVLYTTYRFQWTELDNGMALATIGVMFAVVQGGLTGKAVAKLGERLALLIGLTINATAFVLYGLATSGWMLYPIMVFMSFAGIAGPSLQSLVTRRVPADEQGALQGALTGVQSMAAVVGPLLATQLFGYFTSDAAPMKVPGAAFLAGAVIVVAAALVAVRASREEKTPSAAPAAEAA
ncbi:MAG: TCR/Tet family MFS transporter [Myxococcota bacterium]